jgi:hypothetical protein
MANGRSPPSTRPSDVFCRGSAAARGAIGCAKRVTGAQRAYALSPSTHDSAWTGLNGPFRTVHTMRFDREAHLPARPRGRREQQVLPQHRENKLPTHHCRTRMVQLLAHLGSAVCGVCQPLTAPKRPLKRSPPRGLMGSSRVILCGQLHRSNVFQDCSKCRLRCKAHGSISVQEGQPSAR